MTDTEKINEARKKLAQKKSKRIAVTQLTKGNKQTISLAISKLPDSDRKDIFKIANAVAELLAEKFGTRDEEAGYYVLTEGSDYQLKRAGMLTVGDITDKVTCYLKKYA